MFTSPVLRTVGLVWKPIKANATTKRNTRLQAKRVAEVEAFLKPYKLSTWNKTTYKNQHELKEAKVVTLENYEQERALQLAREERLARKAAKKVAKRLAAEEAVRQGVITRDDAAKQLVAKLAKEGLMKPYPTF